MRPSDRTLRRAAWICWGVVVTVSAVRVVAEVNLRGAGRSSWGASGVALEIAFSLVILSFPLAGLLVALRQPRNAIGWVLVGIGLVWAVDCFLFSYATFGLVVTPGSLPAAEVLAAINEGFWAPLIGLIGTFLILLFPDGRLPSPRWRPVAWLSTFSIVAVVVLIDLQPTTLVEAPVPGLANPLGVESLGTPLAVALGVVLPLIPLCMLASAAALVLRFRRSHGVERLQLTWLAAAGAVVAALYIVTFGASLLTGLTEDPPAWVAGLQSASVLAFALFPLAIGIAVRRHRLYDIDVVINRALVYGALTATLAAAYLVAVLVLQVVLSPVTERSDLAVAGSTLAVAALFGPARRRIQDAVDRRFFRRRYDSVRTLERFGYRLRDELDVETVAADLQRVVGETVQPAYTSLWLRGPA